MPTLKARREEIDMVETYKILTRKSNVREDTWFTRNVTADGGRETRIVQAPSGLVLTQNFIL
jgi:hypothetical protein